MTCEPRYLALMVGHTKDPNSTEMYFGVIFLFFQEQSIDICIVRDCVEFARQARTCQTRITLQRILTHENRAPSV